MTQPVLHDFGHELLTTAYPWKEAHMHPTIENIWVWYDGPMIYVLCDAVDETRWLVYYMGHESGETPTDWIYSWIAIPMSAADLVPYRESTRPLRQMFDQALAPGKILLYAEQTIDTTTVWNIIRQDIPNTWIPEGDVCLHRK